MVKAFDLTGLETQAGIHGSTLTIASLGAAYDQNDWLLSSEIEYSKKEDSTSSDYAAAYLSAAHKFGKFTPFLTLAGIQTTHLPKVDTAIGAGNAALTGGIGALNRQAGTTILDQKSVTLGARWDVASSTALKLQASYVAPEDESYSTLTNREPGFQPGQSYHVISATVDFVF
jgi:hypothetical protein